MTDHGINQCSDNTDNVILRHISAGMACFIVGVPRLGLKRQEDRHPLLRGGKLEHQSPVLPNAIISHMGRYIPLIHMNVMNTVAWFKAENFVSFIISGPQR